MHYAEDHVFERLSVARDHEILTEALRHGRGRIALKDLLEELSAQEKKGEILRHKGEIATAASLEREREMIRGVNRSIGGSEPLRGDGDLTLSSRLSEKQKGVIDFVLRSRDGVLSICGAAGTGKTALLEELNGNLKRMGRGVLAVAPTMSAVDELRKVGFQDAVTIESLLQNTALQWKIMNHILIVDEAGMVSARQMRELLKLGWEKSLRVVFSGDTHQIQSVEAGDALRILEKESRLKSATLTEVRRQSPQDYREAVEKLRENPGKGLEKLDAMGAVREVPLFERSKSMAECWHESRKKAQDALVVCATHEEIDWVSREIRARRKKAGELGKSREVIREVPMNWTEAQKGNLVNFRPGQFLGFHKAVRGQAATKPSRFCEWKRTIWRSGMDRVQRGR